MTKKQYHTILFDWDGCLANSLPIWLKSFHQTFEQHKITVTDRDIIDNGMYHFDDIVKFGVTDLQQFSDDLYVYFKQNLKDVVFQEEAFEIVCKLKKKDKKIAIVTSSKRDVLDTQLNALACVDYFDCTMTWADTELNKPNPEPVLKAMEKLGAEKESTLMIGDSDIDILAAQAAGVTSIWYHPLANELFFPPGHFAHHKPDFTIKHFDELLSIV